MEFPDTDPDAFPSKEKVADYFVAYAEMIAAPIRCGVEVKKIKRHVGRPGFRVETSEGVIDAGNVIAATGAFQNPVIPAIVPKDSGVMQIHSSAYKNPEQLQEGAVLVVGSGSSGAQIAVELMHAGRRVYLSVRKHQRPPRAFRTRDYSWWLGVLGKWDAAPSGPNMAHVTIAVSGARGGETVDFRRLAKQGMILVGSAESYIDGKITFAQDLQRNIERGNDSYLSMLDEAGAYAVRFGLDLPEDPEARKIEPVTACETNPILDLNLAQSGVTSIIWATGFTNNYNWLDVDVFDANGILKHQRGVSSEPGLFFLGLPWQSRRGSSFIWGVWHDARYLADYITTQRKYLMYHMAANERKAAARAE
jgi:putative flavoprotein involved in K+ transport